MRTLVLLLAVSSGCAAGARSAEIESLRAAQARHDALLSEYDARVERLGAEWDDVRRAYDDASVRFQEANRRFSEARGSFDTASEAFARAQAEWELAAQRYHFVELLLALAGAVDKARSEALDGLTGGADRASYSGIVCENLTTAAYRRQLQAQGVDLGGMDIDHIVPRSLGGADNPANYRVVSSHVNRSLGNTWDVAKCLSVGRQCAVAVAISKICGTFAGGLP